MKARTLLCSLCYLSFYACLHAYNRTRALCSACAVRVIHACMYAVGQGDPALIVVACPAGQVHFNVHEQPRLQVVLRAAGGGRALHLTMLDRQLVHVYVVLALACCASFNPNSSS